jgi:hypothetical protein
MNTMRQGSFGSAFFLVSIASFQQTASPAYDDKQVYQLAKTM